MPTENAAEKAKRLLAEGRLTITTITDTEIVAECRGDSGSVYKLGWTPDGAGDWHCDCPARSRCSHLRALWLVAVRPPPA